jgi:hypothetical protein
MKARSIVLSFLLIMATLVAAAQTTDDGFQMAQVVSIDRVSADARHPENADQYKISMRLGDAIYTCHATGSPAIFLDWSPNKEFPAKLTGKVMQVKGPQGLVDLNVVGKKTPK